MVYLENKKIITPIVLILLLAGIIFVLSGKIGRKNKQPLNLYERTAASLLSSDVAERATLDTDGDGLRDWEETLWKTDPKKQDTDNDGYTDKQETVLDYDPLDNTSNPQTGKKAESQYSTPEERKLISEKTNFTQSFSQNITSKIKDPEELAQSNPDNPFTLLDEQTGMGLLGFIESFNVLIPEEEIKTQTDNSYSAVLAYVEKIEKAIPQAPYPDTDEDDLLAEAIEIGNFKKIDEYINYFKTIISNMNNITVPSDFEKTHKRKIELFMATQKVYESVKEVQTDSLKTVLALQENQKIREEMSELIIDFVQLVKNHAQ